MPNDIIEAEEQFLGKPKKGDNAKYLKRTLEIASQPPVDLYNPNEVKERIKNYFQAHIDKDMKPTVVGLGLALGIDRRRLWEIRTGALLGGITDKQYPRETVSLVCTAHEVLANLHEDYMINGKINPAIAVFMGVNYFDMKDVKQTEHVYIGGPNMEDTKARVDDIRERFKNAKPIEEEETP